MKNQRFFLSIVLISFLLLSACKEKDDLSSNENTFGNSYPYQTTVSGRVFDISNIPLSGVAVTSNGRSTETDCNGVFVLKNLGINKERCIIHFTKSGYFLMPHAFKPHINSVNYLKIVLNNNTWVPVLSSTTGGTVGWSNDFSVQFPPDAFVTSDGATYNGQVNIAMRHLSPDDANFGFSIPGGDLLGKDASDNDVALYSYGMLGVQLTGSGGEVLQLASGTSAKLSVAIAPAQLAAAPSTIPLWYLDETTSLWKEEGVAIKMGNEYVGTVTHFTWWNCDYPGSRATLTGLVVDCKGSPMPNVVVTLDGTYDIITDQNGMYNCWVPSGMPFTVQVLSINNPGIINSQLENIPVLAAGQTFTVPNLILICPSLVTGDLKSCAGINTDGMVYLRDDNNFFSYQYTINGKFRLPAINGQKLFLKAGNIDGTGQLLIPAIPAIDTVDVGNILLCNASDPIYDNSFVINGNFYNNEMFIIDTTGLNQFSSSDSIYCTVNGKDQITGFNCTIDLNVHGTGIGTYYYSNLINSLSVDIDGIGGFSEYQNHYTNTTGTIEITRYDNVGGKVQVSFSGTLRNQNGSMVYITKGRLTVPRM